VLGVIGPSAAGKSTLARMIAGTATPSAGKVRLDGADIGVWLDVGGARYIGYLPQDIELFAGTVRDNITRLGEAESEAVIEAAKLAGLHETIIRLPQGYDSDIGEAGVKLSGGQRQRVGLARALFGTSRLVILDEPNASLDNKGEAALVRAIAALKQRRATAIVIAHQPSILRLADKLIVLRDGMVEAFGNRDAVAAKLNRRPVTTPEKRSGSVSELARSSRWKSGPGSR
jgi:ABC-type protease/lipase transport system fused ATPase/permease subunit